MVGRCLLNGIAPTLIRVDATADISEALSHNGVALGRPVVVCVGGAGKMTQEESASIATLIGGRCVPAFERWGVTVVDGGTAAGLMQLLGDGRVASNGSFQLVGVAAEGKVRQPDRPESAAEDAADIEPNHSHIVLVPGDAWGDETPWLSSVASEISAGSPSCTLVVNGGAITLDDALASISAARPLIVLDGSGRTADEIARARRGEPADDKATEIAASELTSIVQSSDHDAVLAALATALGVG
jgi:TRPM family ion channel